VVSEGKRSTVKTPSHEEKRLEVLARPGGLGVLYWCVVLERITKAMEARKELIGFDLPHGLLGSRRMP